jgi:transposase
MVAHFTAPPAPQIIPNGLPTTALLVQIVFAKFGLHLPLHRQGKEYGRLGLPIAKSTMCGWLAALTTFLLPIYEALRLQVLASTILFSDDIPEDMLDPGSGKSKQVRFWSYLGSGPDPGALPQVVFAFAEDRNGRHPSEMLAHYHGVLMTDALAQYDLIALANAIVRVFCWAHARRYFYEARHPDPRCHEMLILIGKLYAAEARVKARAEHDQWDYQTTCRWRFRLRRGYSKQVLAQIKDHLDIWEPNVGKKPALPESPLGKAVMYLLNRWTDFTRYAETGDFPIDNNPVENAQRPIAVVRKNQLFLGSEGGGQVAAICYTLIQSCRLQKVDPVAYMVEACTRKLAGETDYAALTPAAIAVERATSDLQVAATAAATGPDRDR